MSNHHSLTGADIHVPFAWTYANASARTGATGFVSEDVNKFALQTDNNSVWLLTATTPTWQQVSPGTGEMTASDFNATGLTGATAGARLVGATASGAPASGTFSKGDFVIDQTGTIWICTTAGAPGAWAQVSGGAATHGQTLARFRAQEGVPPSSNFATQDLRGTFPVLDFVSGATSDVIFSSILPRSYGGGGFTVTIYWVALTATSGNVKWFVSFERDNAGNHNAGSDNFASAQNATTTTNGSNGLINSTTIPFTDGAQIDSIAAGDPFRMKVERQSGDTMSDTAQLMYVEIKES